MLSWGQGYRVVIYESRFSGTACGKTRTRVLCTAGAIMSTVKESGSDYARPRGLQAQRRHCAAQLAQPGVLGKASTHAFLAIPARGHQIWRVARAGDVPRAPRGSGAAARPRENPRAHARLAALRG